MSTLYTHFIGIDIGKFECVANVYGSKTTTSFANNSDGITKFYNEFKSSLEKGLVVCEVTGGYERLVIEQLQNHEIAVHRANGRQVKNFIRSYGIIGKNDHIDAKALGAYAFERHPKLALYERNAHESLREANERRDDLVRMRTAEKNRSSAPGGQSCATNFEAVISVLNAQIELIDTKIATLIASDPELLMKIEMLKTVPGVGNVVATAILSHMPEIGTMNQKQAASLAGVAPHPNQSGMKNGYRRTRGGRRQMRPILFMSALSASRSKSVLGDFYQHLLGNGKPKMCAIVAVARKIIVIANARIKEALAAAQKNDEALASLKKEDSMVPA